VSAIDEELATLRTQLDVLIDRAEINELLDGYFLGFEARRPRRRRPVMGSAMRGLRILEDSAQPGYQVVDALLGVDQLLHQPQGLLPRHSAHSRTEHHQAAAKTLELEPALHRASLPN
jgi:hypothetical protein